MKHLATLSIMIGALCLATPATGWSKDHDHHNNRSCAVYRPYCAPRVAIRSYRPYGIYGAYGYRPYGYYPSYYAAPSVAFTYASGPAYQYQRTTRDAESEGDLATDVQRALARQGLYHGAIDGDVGPGTRSAIREYQYRHRLEVTGRIDRSLLRALGLT